MTTVSIGFYGYYTDQNRCQEYEYWWCVCCHCSFVFIICVAIVINARLFIGNGKINLQCWSEEYVITKNMLSRCCEKVLWFLMFSDEFFVNAHRQWHEKNVKSWVIIASVFLNSHYCGSRIIVHNEFIKEVIV